MLKDKYILEKNLDLSYTKCYACNLKSHSIEFCPRILFLPDKLFIIQRHIYSEPTLIRNLHKRKANHSPNARINLLTITQNINKFLLNLDQKLLNESINDLDDTDSQKSVSLSLIMEEESQDNLHKDPELEKRAGSVRARKNEDLNAFRGKVEELLQPWREEGGGLDNETSHASKGGAYGTRGKDESLTFEGYMNNFNHNPHLSSRHNPNNRKSRKEETWKESESPNKRGRNKEMMNGEEFGARSSICRKEETWKGGDSPTKRGRNREIINGEEFGARSGSILNANGMAKMRESAMSWSIEGVEMGKNLNRLDSKKYSFQVQTLIREDLMFRYIKMF